MRTAGFAVASQQGVLISLDEHQRNRMIFLEMLQKRRQFLELQALARVHQQGCSGEVAFACGMKFRKNGYEIDRKVVHAVERSEEHTSELQSRRDLVCRLLLEKKKKKEHEQG